MKRANPFQRLLDQLLHPARLGFKRVLVLVVWVLYILIFFFIQAEPKAPWAILAVLPIAIAAWYLGTVYGLVVAVLAIVINFGILRMTTTLPWAELLGIDGMPANIIILAMAGIAGQAGWIYRKQSRSLLESERAEELERTKVHFLTLLNDITRAALEVNDQNAMLEVVIQRIGQLFAADNSVVVLWNETEKRPMPIVANGPASKVLMSMNLQAGQKSLTATALQDGHPLNIKDIQALTDVDPNAIAKTSAKSALVLPLIAGERKIGAVILTFNHEREFSSVELEQAELAANQISLAMTKVFLLEEARQRLKELSGLNEISKVFGVSANRYQVYNLLTEKLASLIGAKKCFITLYNQDDEQIQAQTPGYGLGEDTIAGLRFPISAMVSLFSATELDTVLANNADELPARLKDFARSFKIQSLVVAPMRAKGQLLGMLFAANKPGGFTRDDARLMSIFTAQASAVIQSALLIETTKQQARSQTALFELSKAMVSSLEADDICQRVIAGLENTLGYNHAALFMVDEMTGERVIQASVGWPSSPKFRRIPPGQGLSELAIQEGRLIYTPDTSSIDKYIPGMYGAEVDVPIWIGDKAMGVLVVESKDKNTFNQQDFDILTAVANLASLALTRARSIAVERRQYEELRVLNQVAEATTQVQKEDEMIERVTQIIETNLYPDNFGVMLLNEADNLLYPHSSYRLPIKRDKIKPIPVGTGITGLVSLDGKVRNIPDTQKAEGYLEFDSRTRSELCVPMKVGSNIIGVINTESSRQNAFPKSDEQLLSTLASQLAMAIIRLRSAETEHLWFTQVVRSNTLVSALAFVASRIETASDPESVMRLMGDELRHLGFNIAIALFEQDDQKLFIRHVSLDMPTIKKIENALDNKLSETQIPVDVLYDELNQRQHPKPVIIKHPLEHFREALANMPKAFTGILFGLNEKNSETPVGQFPLIAKDSTLGYMWLWGKDLRENDLPAMYVFANQVATAIENARLFADVQRLAVIDELTRLYNRRRLFELANQECARSTRYGRYISILMIDIDHFKHVNDTHGHMAGDELLAKVADVLQCHLRAPDILGRYGGEEFMAVLPETNAKGALTVAERLRSAIENDAWIQIGKHKVGVTISIGVAARDDFSPDLDTLVARADQALYVAKFKGRNRVAVGA